MRDYFLKSKRVGFSQWKPTDINHATSLWGNPNVTRYISATGTFSNTEVVNRLFEEIELQNEYNYSYFPIFTLDNDEFIGCCGLHIYDEEKRILELGFHLVEGFWHKGYAYEVASRIISYGFTILKANAIFIGHNPNNLASKNVIEKLGFVYTHDEFYESTDLMHPSYILEKV